MQRGGEGANRRVSRVNRGGNWDNTARNCRAANRNWNEPTNVNDNIGFRLASSADGSRRASTDARPVQRPDPLSLLSVV